MLETFLIVLSGVHVASGVEKSFLNIVLVACSLIVGVRVKICLDSTSSSPEGKGISGPATLATKVDSVARDEVLLRKPVEGTILDSVPRLSTTSGHEGPAGAASGLITDGVNNTPVTPVNQFSVISVRSNESIIRVRLNATSGVLGVTVVGAVIGWFSAVAG